MSVNKITFTGGAANGNVTIAENNCSSIDAGKSCDVKLQATANAHTGQAIIDYGYDNRVTDSKITVAKSTLKLYKIVGGNPEEIPPDEEIFLKEEAPVTPVTFRWVNEGKFNWLDPYIKWKGTVSSGIILDEGNCGTESSPGNKVLSDGHCSFKITIDGANVGARGILDTLSGKKTLVKTYEKNVVVPDGIIILKNTNADDYHLGYRSLKIVNSTSGSTINLNKVDILINPDVASYGKIKYCPHEDPTDCHYKTDLECREGTYSRTLGPKEHCKIWFKSQSDPATTAEEEKLYVDKNVPIEVEVQPTTGTCDKASFLAETDQAFYIGGEFAYNNHITKWNGTEWEALEDGINGYVYAVKTRGDNSDLYVGGAFPSPSHNAVVWNGSHFSPLSTNGNINSTVSDFIYNPSDNYLYVSGHFNSPSNKIFRCDVNNVCENVPGNPLNPADIAVYTSLIIGDYIYFGGNFGVGFLSDNLIRYRYTDNVWDGMDAGTNASVLAFAKDYPQSDHIQVGSAFDQVWPGHDWDPYQPKNYRAWARWKGSYWTDTPFLNLAYSPAPVVRCMETMDIAYGTSSDYHHTFVGGDFEATDSGGYGTQNIIRIRYDNNEHTEYWYRLNESLNSTVFTLSTLGFSVFVAGEFTNVGHRVAEWNELNNTWHSFGGTVIDKSVRDPTIATSLKIEFEQAQERTP